MPRRKGWRGAEYPGEFPSLGWLVADWIEAHCVIPDRAVAGEPFRLSDEQLEHLVWQYRLHPDATSDPDRPAAPFVYYGALIVRSQKWGKAPLSAARICAQAVGPVLFAGWDAQGEPVGMPWATPHIQVAATAEDQTANIWRALKPMIELGPLATVIPDTGLDRMNLRGGGVIERVSSASTTRLGARLTYLEIDQPESMTATNGGEKLVDVLLRNVAPLGGRWAATGNAHDPTEKSVQQTWVEKPLAEIYVDYPEPPAGSWTNKRDRRRILKHAYRGAPWVDIPRIEADCDRLAAKGDPAQAERFFGNRVVAGAGAAFATAAIDAARTHVEVPSRSLVVIGVDGARFVDALGMVATVVEGPAAGEQPRDHQFPLGIWQRPEGAPDDYEHPADEIDGAMIEAFELFDVWRVYVDPQYIEHLLERWQGRWGPKRVLPWPTHRPRQAAWMVRNYTEAFAAGDLTVEDAELLVQHLRNARKKPLDVYDDQHRRMHTLAKESADSRLKIDGAMAGALSWEARGDCIAAGKPRSRSASQAHFL